jgi:phage terminase large subunit-like protein
MARSKRPRPAQLAAGTDLVDWLSRLPPDLRREAVAALGPEDGEALDRAWAGWAHDGQRAPATCADGSAWSTWVLMAGRGFGKTLAGAQWLTERIAAADGQRGTKLSIALVGASLEDARRVMVEGRSGLLTVAQPWVRDWSPSLRRLRFVTGAEATIFSGASPDLLRGPEHHLAWCDELAKWERASDCWEMLQLGLRLDDPDTGAAPRALITTTPRAGPVLRQIMAEAGTVVTRGRTAANPHTSPAWKARVAALYGGTRLGRQELDGELLPEAGALWTPELIARCRAQGSDRAPIAMQRVETPSDGQPAPWSGDRTDVTDLRRDGSVAPFTRTLIAVDPPSGEGTCGIIACACDADGIAHVLADHSVTGRSPEGWARAVASAAAAHGTAEVVAEANQGGRMVKAVLLAADASLNVRLVTARVGKSLRAEPVAHLCEAGRVRLHGRMPELEAQLLGLIAGGGYEGPGTSPDRADAMVWGVGEVVRGRGVRVRGM